MMFPYLWMAMLEANITTYRRAIHFLAQLLHESGELIYMEEIADGSAYEGRSDLGNVYRGDGRRYKGRGPIQLTGRANYRAAGKALGLDLEGRPAIAADPSVGFRIAAWYWTSRNLNYYADMGDSGFDAITYRINGGYNGLYQRAAFYNHAAKVLPSPFDIGGGLVLQKVVLAATGDPDLVEAFKVAALLRKYNIFATVADAMNIQPADGVCWSTPIGTFDFFVIGKPAYNLMHTGHTPLIGKSADKTDYRDAVGAGFDDTKRKLALRLTELGKKRKLTIDLGEEYKKGV
jgi:predicted chitinase